MSATKWGAWFVHYPIDFDDGFVLDCQECGQAWPCAGAPDHAIARAQDERTASGLSSSGSEATA